MTSIRILPIGAHESPDTMPWNVVLLGSSIFSLIPSFCIVSRYMILMLLPLSMRTLLNLTLLAGPTNVGSIMRAYPLGFGMILG
jgi:hypothetical protein